MTKTTTVPHLLEQLSVELHANGVKFDTATAYGVKVALQVRVELVSEKHDQAHVVLEKVYLPASVTLFADDAYYLDINPGINIFHLLSRGQVAAIEENLLAQMAGNN